MPDSAPDAFDRTIPEEGHQTLGGQFEVIRKLGEGGMGEVHLARDRNLDDRLVAVKLLPALRASAPRAMKQLRAEAARYDPTFPLVLPARGLAQPMTVGASVRKVAYP